MPFPCTALPANLEAHSEDCVGHAVGVRQKVRSSSPSVFLFPDFVPRFILKSLRPSTRFVIHQLWQIFPDRHAATPPLINPFSLTLFAPTLGFFAVCLSVIFIHWSGPRMFRG